MSLRFTKRGAMANKITFAYCVVCFTVVFIPNVSLGFRSTVSAVDGILIDHTTKTHADITETGIALATHHYLVNNRLANSSFDVVGDFFGSEERAQNEFDVSLKEPRPRYHRILEYNNIENIRDQYITDLLIETVVDANNAHQKDKENEAKFNVNGEQILEAHHLVAQLRMELMEEFEGQLTDTALKNIRLKISHCLFVIQSFYSQTNWVDMNGAVPYNDFGVPGRSLMPIAPADKATCKDCDILSQTCNNPLIVSDMLTSGYRSGQDIVKHYDQSFRPTTGKCSHGGKYDSTRNLPAKGGINKETTLTELSPLAHLHDKASKAAIQATADFFIGKDGIFNNSKHEIFRSVFNLYARKSTVSMVMVIDVSGSMTDDIEAVKKKTIEMITSVQGTDNEPLNYVLVTFNDPVSWGTQFVFDTGDEMIAQIRSLTVRSNSDCPEVSMDGALRGINLANEGSTLYLFTDADAKDCNLKSTVVEEAKKKNIKIKVLLTGYCDGSPTCNLVKRSSGLNRYYRHRNRRSASTFYGDLASSTGGILYQTTKEELANVLQQTLEEDFPTSKVSLLLKTIPSTESDEILVPVDSDIRLLKIEVSGPTVTSEASLRNPSGVMETFTGNSSLFYSESKIIMSIQNPAKGVWTLTRIHKVNWYVNVTAQASIYITHKLIETDVSGLSYGINGNPIAGKNYSLQINVYSLIENATNTTVVVLDKSGNEHSSMALPLSQSALGSFGLVIITMPAETINIQLKGRDREGNMFIRISDTTITPVDAKLELGSVLGSLHVGTAHNLPYTITNAGDTNQTYTVTYTDDKGYHSSVTNIMSHFLSPGQSKNANFQITGTVDKEIVEYTITLTLAGSNEILQSLSNTLSFTAKLHPVCSVTRVEGNCTNEDLNVDKCSKKTWSASMEIATSVKLSALYLTNNNSYVTMVHGDITVTSSPVYINVTGTCCTPSVYINAIDEESYTDRCHIYFGDPYKIVIVVHGETPTKNLKPNEVAYATIIGLSTAACILLIIAVPFVCWLSKKQKNNCNVNPYIARKDEAIFFANLNMYDKNSNPHFAGLSPVYHAYSKKY